MRILGGERTEIGCATARKVDAVLFTDFERERRAKRTVEGALVQDASGCAGSLERAVRGATFAVVAFSKILTAADKKTQQRKKKRVTGRDPTTRSRLRRYAYLPKNGMLAIFSSDARGHMGKAPIGLVALLVGDHRNFKVTLNPAPKSGTQLWAVLEQSTRNTEPFKRFDGKPVEESFKAL